MTIYHISDEINGDLFLLEEAESIRRMPGGRPKLVEHTYAHAYVAQHCDYITDLTRTRSSLYHCTYVRFNRI